MVHFFRPHRRFAIPLHLLPVADSDTSAIAENASTDTNVHAALDARVAVENAKVADVIKRQAWLEQYQSELSASAARAAATATQSQSRGGGANPATSGTTVRSDVSTHSTAPTFMVGRPVAQTVSESSAVTTSSVRSTQSSVQSTIRSSPSTSSAAPTSTSSSSSVTSTTVRTITASQPSSATAVRPSTSADSAQQSTSSTSLSTGAIVGIVLAVLVGVVILGSAFGWLYRKFASRGYKDNSRWRKLDEDITPFPTEKYRDSSPDDIYGGAPAPIIGSGRALANTLNRDGATYGQRPQTEYSMYERNRAGVGSGMDAYGNPSPNPSPMAYGHDVQGRPYNGQAGRVPIPVNIPQHPYDYGYPDEKYSPNSSRQLLGNGYNGGAISPYDAGPELSPVPLGRPAAPDSYADIASREDYADELPPSEYMPRTAATNEWAGTASYSQSPPHAYTTSAPIGVQLQDHGVTHSAPVPAPAPLPTLRPLSPLSSGFDFNRQSQSFGAMAAVHSHGQAPTQDTSAQDEQARQKQLYGEVARAAGFPEPKTPHSASLDHSMSSNSAASASYNTANTTAADSSMASTSSSFSAPERLPSASAGASQQRTPPALPPLNPPRPYEHGRPLSPLVEVSTPSTINMPVPISSSSIGHVARDREVNPFEQQAAATGYGQSQSGYRTLVAPPHAQTATGAAYPSARYPPPSPGGMSLPGSVTDSPAPMGRQQGQQVRKSRGESVFDEDDVYGGI